MTRKHELEKFLQRLIKHRLLSQSEILFDFLSCEKDEQFTVDHHMKLVAPQFNSLYLLDQCDVFEDTSEEGMSAVVMNTLYGSKKDQLEGLFGEFLDKAKAEASAYKVQ